ncbi:MAG: FAD:protein FMN transferase [Rikenellaceae bacterium]
MVRVLSRLVFLALITMFWVGCDGGQRGYVALSGKMLGTTYHLKADIDSSLVGELEQRITQLDTRVKSEMSLFDPTSQLSRINRGESDELTPWLEFNISLADSVSRLSGGLFDITVAPLVEALGFAGDEAVERPNIDSLLEFVGYRGIELREGRIIKRDERMQIDLNSIAKGFTVDLFAELLEQMGAQNYIVDIGGELRLEGVNEQGEGWRVGIESPFDGNMSEGEFLERRLQIEPNSEMRAIATSGNYRRFYLNDKGEKVVHTINPITGSSSPSTLLSVSVLAPTCALADAYATMLMAAGDGGAEALAERIENCEVYFIYGNARAHEKEQSGEYREYLSEGVRSRLLE